MQTCASGVVFKPVDVAGKVDERLLEQVRAGLSGGRRGCGAISRMILSRHRRPLGLQLRHLVHQAVHSLLQGDRSSHGKTVTSTAGLLQRRSDGSWQYYSVSAAGPRRGTTFHPDYGGRDLPSTPSDNL